MSTQKRRTKPKIEIDPHELERCARAGFNIAETAAFLGVSESTIYNRKRESADFAEAIKRGKLAAHAEVGNKLFEQCKQGNVSAIIWYEKTRRGLSWLDVFAPALLG
jgi:hypothetical protein